MVEFQKDFAKELIYNKCLMEADNVSDNQDLRRSWRSMDGKEHMLLLSLPKKWNFERQKLSVWLPITPNSSVLDVKQGPEHIAVALLVPLDAIAVLQNTMQL